MNVNLKLSLEQLKRRFTEGKRALEQQHLLLSKREEMCGALLALNNGPSYVALKRQQQELDHLLDHYDEWSENELEEVKKNYITALLQSFPEQRLPYTHRQNELSHKKQFLQKLDILFSYSSKIETNLQTVIRTRLSIKGRGILNYIFGVSPNTIIEKHLIESGSLARSALETWQQTAFLPAFPWENIKTSLMDLAENAHKPWGFSHIDTIFTIAAQQMKYNNTLICDWKERIEEEKQLLEKEEELWLLEPAGNSPIALKKQM